jgi:hypothetical protein
MHKFHDIVSRSRSNRSGAHRGRGFARLYDDDHEQLAAASVVYDALYAYCQQSLAEAR